MAVYIFFDTKVPGDKTFTGVGRKDSCYKYILGTVGHIKDQYRHGEFDNIIGGMGEDSTSHERMARRTEMSSIYVRSGARGRKVVNGDDATEK